MTEARKEMIRNLYDRSPDLTLGQLSRMTGLTVAQLKKILMEN